MKRLKDEFHGKKIGKFKGECSDVSTTIIVFASLPSFMSLCVFVQDVFHAHGNECTHTNIRITHLRH